MHPLCFSLSSETPSSLLYGRADISLASALPILRQLGAQGGGTTLLKNVREGDFSMLRIWVGLEGRQFLQASADQVETCVKYDRLSPNV